jgi:hypothetical protein
MLTLDDIERPVEALKVYGVMAFTGDMIGEVSVDSPEFSDVYVAARIEGEPTILRLDEESRREYDPDEETLGVYEAGVVYTQEFFSDRVESCDLHVVEIEFGRGFWRLRPAETVEAPPRGTLDVDDEPEETEE